MNLSFRTALTLAPLLFTALLAQAQTYPSKSVRVPIEQSRFCF